jgi:hypothetical protein
MGRVDSYYTLIEAETSYKHHCYRYVESLGVSSFPRYTLNDIDADRHSLLFCIRRYPDLILNTKTYQRQKIQKLNTCVCFFQIINEGAWVVK